MKDPYENIKLNLNAAEQRELKHIQAECSRRFQNFWARAMKRQGWTNVAIAKEQGISESTVRSIFKKES